MDHRLHLTQQAERSDSHHKPMSTAPDADHWGRVFLFLATCFFVAAGFFHWKGRWTQPFP